MGVERWEIMADFLKNPEMDMFELRKKLNYTNSYDNLAEYPWVTEISHGDEMTTQKALDFHLNGKDSPYYDDYLKAMKIMNQKYRNRSRFSYGMDRTWQTVHSCIYDIENHSGQIQIQEGLEGRLGWNFKI